MAMAAASMEATASILLSHPIPSSLPYYKHPLHSSIQFKLPIPTLPLLIHKFPVYPLNPLSSTRPNLNFELRSSFEEVALLENQNPIEESQEEHLKRKLYVVNLAWSTSVDDLKNTFGECGVVKDVELIKSKNGKSRGYAFVTMATGDEAKVVVEKFHLKELSGRTIRIEYARRLKKPRPQAPADTPAVTETRHKLYVSNLQWKVRSTHLRELFSANFKPVSTRVVFESASGKSSGYGFVSFSTREEAEAAVSSLDGKELLGRPIRLKFSEKNVTGEVGDAEKGDVNEREGEVVQEEVPEGQPEKS